MGPVSVSILNVKHKKKYFKVLLGKNDYVPDPGALELYRESATVDELYTIILRFCMRYSILRHQKYYFEEGLLRQYF